MRITHKIKIWQTFISVYSTIIAIYVPVNIVLNIYPDVQLKYSEWLTTIVFIADIFINYFKPSSEILLHSEIKNAKMRYLKTWFPADLLAAIPFSLILANPVFGLIRLFKITSVLRFMHILRQRAVQFGDYLLLIFFVFWLLLLSHWLSCGWIFLRGIDPRTI